MEKIFKKCEWVNTTKEWIVPKFGFNQNTGIIFSKAGEKLPNKFS